jgi:hypothetical protein
MAWMLGLADTVLPGTGLFVAFDVCLLSASMLSLLFLAPRLSWLAVGVVGLEVVLPQFVLYQGIVWKDVLFADAAVAGFVVLAQAASRWRKAGLRWALILAAFLLFALATLVRQNGVLALLFGALALVVAARKNGFAAGRAMLCGAAAALVAVCVIALASLALAERTSEGSGPLGQIRLLQFYDLIGGVKADPAIKLDVLSRANPALARLIRSDGVRLYTPARNDTLYGSAALINQFNMTAPAAIVGQWTELLLQHPFEYLAVRARVFAWTFLTPDPVGCDDWYAGATGAPQYLRDLGLQRRFRPQDRALVNYSSLFAGTPVFSHAAYGMLALALLIFLSWRAGAADLAIASLLACALVFAASFFVISIACDYRYLYFLDLAALIGFFYCVVTSFARLDDATVPEERAPGMRARRARPC